MVERRIEQLAAPSRHRMETIGVMSGSSLDGLDLACCTFTKQENGWRFDVRGTRALPFPPTLRSALLHAADGTAWDLVLAHRDLGRFIGDACAVFRQEFPADLICSHGHTIFHQPAHGITTQVGCGATIAARSGLATVCDLRSKDVALGGQGAPLVPIGERALFPEYSSFLNLGGISNLAVHRSDTSVGYDIGPCNQALNALAEEAGLAYDADGALARTGSVSLALLARLEALPFYVQPPPRSLGREWFETHFRPLIAEPSVPLVDRMRTVVEHLALRINAELSRSHAGRCLVTGGGAHHGLLMERLRALASAPVEMPSAELVDFKEAIIFGFLGVLRWREEVNALASVTGAPRDSIGGAVYLPN